jgi:hypothetical protein
MRLFSIIIPTRWGFCRPDFKRIARRNIQHKTQKFVWGRNKKPEARGQMPLVTEALA